MFYIQTIPVTDPDKITRHELELLVLAKWDEADLWAGLSEVLLLTDVSDIHDAISLAAEGYGGGRLKEVHYALTKLLLLLERHRFLIHARRDETEAEEKALDEILQQRMAAEDDAAQMVKKAA